MKTGDPLGLICVVFFLGGTLMLAVELARRGLRMFSAPSRPRAGSRVYASVLNTVLLYWNGKDAFRVRDLLNGGCLILGRAGSGKTSSSGRSLMQAIVDDPRSGGLILAAKPEDEDDVKEVFAAAGRENDLIVFAADGPYRFSFLDYVGRGDTRGVVQCIMAIGETLKRREGQSGGNDSSPFWEAQNERVLYNAVGALQLASEPVTSMRIHQFIIGAASAPEELPRPAWKSGYHNRVLEKGFNGKKTPVQAHDYELIKDFWVKEWPTMDPKTRSNVLVGVMQILHVYNTGIVREMVSGGTNASPDAMFKRKWILVTFPPSKWGAAGSFICTGWKYLAEQSILKREVKGDDSYAVIWCDEAHLFTNSFDSSFIAQCRSHRGCLVFLTQSVSSFYAAMPGHSGRHQADALLANFSHVIIHASDPVTAKWASSKLGRERQIMVGGGSSPQKDIGVYEELMGHSPMSFSFSEQYHPVLEDQAFQHNLRTGGPDNAFLADAIVIKSGEPFASGDNYQFVTFSQQGKHK